MTDVNFRLIAVTYLHGFYCAMREFQSANRSDMFKTIQRFTQDESGATAIEYGLIVALIAVVIVGAVSTLGTTLRTKFTTINASIH